MKRQKRSLSQFTLPPNRRDKTPTKSHLFKGWTMSALDNENFFNQNSISGTNIKNYTAQVSSVVLRCSR